MPSTHLSLHYHIIFSTKGRRRIIAETWREDLHAYMGGIVRDVGAVAGCIGGPGDHVHALVGLKATHAGGCGSPDEARFIGVDSPTRCKQVCVARRVRGFTVCPSQLSRVHRYIANQMEHHRKKTFEEEYVELLRLSRVEFEEKYLW